MAAAIGVAVLATGVLSGCGGDAPVGTGRAGAPAALQAAGDAGQGAWMTALAAAADESGTRVGDVAQVGQVLMPGSHDAGSFTSLGWASRACSDSTVLADAYNSTRSVHPTVEKWALTQSAAPGEQAAGGARYFDLRAIWAQAPRTKAPGLFACHTIVTAPLDAFFNSSRRDSLTAFAAANPGEVFVVDWQHVMDGVTRPPLPGGALSPQAVTAFRDYLTGTVCPGRGLNAGDVPEQADVPRMTLSAVTGTGRNIIHVMAGSRLRQITEGLPADQRAAWCVWDRDALLQSNWDTDPAANPWRNGFDYPAARTVLFRNQAGWLERADASVPRFRVNQNIWNIDPGVKIAQLVARKGLRDWTVTDLRPFQRSGFIDPYLAAGDEASRTRLGAANVLMTDFAATRPGGPGHAEVVAPWVRLNCRKFAVPACPLP